MTRFTLMGLFALGLAATGCDNDEEKTDAKEEPGKVSQEVEATEPTAAKPNPEQGNDEGAKAAEQAEPSDGAYCEQAYAEIDEMQRVVEDQLGKKSPLGKKEEFVRACSALPKDLQRCMSMKYLTSHQKECRDAQANVDAETEEKFKKLMEAFTG